MATRERVSLSEQQLMDCAWGADPADDGSAAACDGGDAAVAISYVAKRGGAASTEEYEYEGRPGWCRLEGTRVAARMKGFSRLPRYDDRAIKEALVTRGPLTVAMDASWDSIAFYSGGIYQESRCMSKPGELDHSVVLVGYGRDPVQGAYWLIRNSWGDLWGDRGYVKVSAENGACGVTADALYAVADA
ncbi:papain family cysteine protease [Helicosporidium sp. ATCC 50920]|nr:papain family cysteine protease [Helicosporidium sp. ATCC 50920]|eukprot:KDD76367.1 papain family cysteine protease [Helicosporidium sp. ATCC 50920]